MSFTRSRIGKTIGLAVGVGLAIVGCQDMTETTPAGPSLAQGPSACSFNSIRQDVRSYFPGSGRGSSRDAALDIVASLEAQCGAGQSAAYTGTTFRLLKMFETGLEGGLEGPLGAAATGNAIIRGVITMTSSSVAQLFDPCGPAANCQAWEGFPTTPDFTQALAGPSNLFAVVGPSALGAVLLSGSAAICSGPSAPCGTVTTGSSPETWGFQPAASFTWSDVQDGRTSVFWGHPLSATGPTGETPLSLASGYFATSIPFIADFPGDAQLNVTFCTVEDPATGMISNIAHDISATEPGTIPPWCVAGSHAALASEGFFGTLASLARSMVTVRPLFAVAVHAGSPTGGIGGFGSEFYAFETNPTGILQVLNGPLQNATTNTPIVGANGQPLAVRARTSTSTSANPTVIENVQLALVAGNNNGSIPSDNLFTSDVQDVYCGGDTDAPPTWFTGPKPPGNVCVARTGQDQTLGAGIAVFAGIKSSKNGGFKVDILEWTGSTSPFDFAPVSAGQFNNNPN